MMDVTVDRGPGGGVLSVTASCGGQTVVVVGFCRYWHTDDRVGAYNCDEHVAEFGGPTSWRWDGGRFVREHESPPYGVDVLEGEWVPDDVWSAR